MANKEVWKPIKDRETFYEVSNFGRVRSLPRVLNYADGRVYSYKSRILKQGKGSHGYLMVRLSECGCKTKSVLVHRLVAEAFLDNPSGRRTVNHRDGVKTNNNLSNIEWATDSENVSHAYKSGLNHNGVETLKTGKDCQFFKRAVQAESEGIGVVVFGNKQMKTEGFDPVGIWRCLKGLRKTHRGFRFTAVEGVL